MLMGGICDYVEFVLFSVSCYQMLTLQGLVRAIYEISFCAEAFEPKMVCAFAVSVLIHCQYHTFLYWVVQNRQGFPPKHVSQQVSFSLKPIHCR